MRDIISIIKPGIGVFIALTCYVGFALSEEFGQSSFYIHILVFGAAFITSGGSAAMNMVIERETDRHMDRTKNRPLPTGRMKVSTAVLVSLTCLATGLAVSWLILGLYYFIFMVLGAVVYIFIYTIWLKPRSTWNISIGGLSGSFAALAGGYVGLDQFIFLKDVWIFSAFLFFWSPAHFWNLGIFKREDYKKINFPMLPASTSVEKALFWILVHVLALIACTVLFSTWGDRTILFQILFLPAGLYFLGGAIQNMRNCTNELSRRLFLYSIVYLFYGFICLGIDLAVVEVLVL